MTDSGATALPAPIRRLLVLAGLRGNASTETADLIQGLQDGQLAPEDPQEAQATVHRDLAVLDELARLARQDRTSDDLAGQLPVLSTVDILAAQDALRLLARRGGGQHARLAQVADRLGSGLPQHLRAHPVPQSVLSRPDALHVARQAWATRMPLQFETVPVGLYAQRQTITLHVYSIETAPDTLEAIITGQDVVRPGALRSFQASRIVGARLLDGPPYDIPDEFSLDIPIQTVTLRFTGEARFHVLTGNHAFLSEPTINPDGSIDVDTDVPVDQGGLPTDILPWVLGWGPDAEIVSPAPLRTHWTTLLSRMAGNAHRSPTIFVRGDVA